MERPIFRKGRTLDEEHIAKPVIQEKETLHDFSDRIRRILTRAQPQIAANEAESLMINIFVSGLKPRLRDSLMSKTFSTLNEALEMAEKVWMFRKLDGSDEKELGEKLDEITRKIDDLILTNASIRAEQANYMDNYSGEFDQPFRDRFESDREAYYPEDQFDDDDYRCYDENHFPERDEWNSGQDEQWYDHSEYDHDDCYNDHSEYNHESYDQGMRYCNEQSNIHCDLVDDRHFDSNLSEFSQFNNYIGNSENFHDDNYDNYSEPFHNERYDESHDQEYRNDQSNIDNNQFNDDQFNYQHDNSEIYNDDNCDYSSEHFHNECYDESHDHEYHDQQSDRDYHQFDGNQDDVNHSNSIPFDYYDDNSEFYHEDNYDEHPEFFHSGDY